MSKNNNATQSAQELIGLEAIENNILWTKNRMLFAFIRVKGMDNSLLEDEDNEQLTDKITTALATETEPFQILSVPRAVDIEGMLQTLKELELQSDNAARQQLIAGEAAALQDMAKRGDKEPIILLKVWKAAQPGADIALMKRVDALRQRLEENGINANVLRDDEIRKVCALFADPENCQDDTPIDVPVLSGRKRKFSRREDPDQIAYEQLMEVVTPAPGLFFRKDTVEIGTTFARCYGVVRYPAEIRYNWASTLTGATDCITCITYTPGSPGEIAEQLSKAIRRDAADADAENDVRKRKALERKVDSADEMIDNVDGKDQAVGYLTILVMPFAGSKEALEERCTNVRSRFSQLHMKLVKLNYLQKEAWMCISPYYTKQKKIDDLLLRIFPLDALLGGYPFTVTTIRDDHGVSFAHTTSGELVSLDLKHKDNDRGNGNGIVTGDSGLGKSTFLKSLIQSCYMQGFKVLIIDPEREYREMCKSLGGSWWDAGGGGAKVNLLQIQEPIPDDENDEVYRSDEKPLQQHLQYLANIFRAKIPGLTESHFAMLERAFLTLYKKFGIDLNWEYSYDRDPKEYPVMEDLYKHLVEMAQTDARYEELSLLLERMAVGSDSMIWNGHTNIDLNNDLIVIDTNKLHTSTPSNRAAQYYTLLRMAFSAVANDRKRPYLIVADESQILFDPELPQVSADLKNIALRVRKYEGYLWLSVPSLRGMLDEKVRLNGQPILDAATYKILFGTNGQNLIDTVSLFKLLPTEERILAARQRGRAVALIGAHHMKLEFRIPPYKMRLMGKGGGR